MAKTPYKLSVCSDCISVIANGDYTVLDYSYSPIEASIRKAEIDKGLAETPDGYWIAGQEEYGFCHSKCDCCGTHLHGDRFEAIVWC